MKEYKKIKITFIINKLIFGGIATFLINLLNSINKNKYSIRLIIFQGDINIINKIDKNIEILFFGKQKIDKIEKILSKNFFLKILKLFYFVLNEYISGKKNEKKLGKIISNDEILINCNIRNLTTTIAIKNFKNIKIGWSHADITNDIKILPINRINYLYYKYYSDIISVSKTSMINFEKKFSNIKHHYLYNFLNNKNFKKQYIEKINLNYKYIIGVGRLSVEKDFKMLISSYSKLNKNIKKEYKLLIIGEGPERKNLENFIYRKGEKNNIKLLGYKSNPIKYIKESYIFISSSYKEGFSIVILEAMKCGIPIISTKCIGPNEILESGKYGIMNNIKDEIMMSNNIQKLINNKKLYCENKLKLKNRINYFSEKKIIKKFDKIIEALI